VLPAKLLAANYYYKGLGLNKQQLTTAKKQGKVERPLGAMPSWRELVG